MAVANNPVVKAEPSDKAKATNENALVKSQAQPSSAIGQTQQAISAPRSTQAPSDDSNEQFHDNVSFYQQNHAMYQSNMAHYFRSQGSLPAASFQPATAARQPQASQASTETIQAAPRTQQFQQSQQTRKLQRTQQSQQHALQTQGGLPGHQLQRVQPPRQLQQYTGAVTVIDPSRLLMSQSSATPFDYRFQNVTIRQIVDEQGRPQAQQIQATYNLNHVQCSRCLKSFPNESERQAHYKAARAGCWEHRMCFGWIDNVTHAMEYEHTRCFVSECRHKMRYGNDWDDDAVERHVKKMHGVGSR